MALCCQGIFSMARVITILSQVCFIGVKSANVLALTPFVGNASQSHFYIMLKVADALISRGHRVVLPLHEHMRTDLAEDAEIIQFPSHFTSEEWANNTAYFMPRFVRGDLTMSDFNLMLYNQHLECDVMIRHQELHRKLKAKAFDYAIIDQVFPCGFLYAKRLGLPFVVLECASHHSSIVDTIDPFPLSYVPVMLSGFTDKMTFVQRLSNTYLYYLNVLSSGLMLQYYETIGKDLGIITGETIVELKGNAELWVSNQAWFLDFPRPTLPNVIMTGGLLTMPAKDLPPDLASVVNAASHGIIVVSFGSYLDISVLQAFQATLLEGFSRLSQTVIWATKNPPSRLPANVKSFEWIPQNDLLGHPQTKACILHGGINGIYEAIYHGVPMLVVAAAFDAIDNAVRVSRRGAGLVLTQQDVTPEGVHDALLQLVHNQSYKENVQRLSAIMNDQPWRPIDKASFWIDHVIPHGGGYLRPAGNDLSLIQLYRVDVLAFNAVLFFILLIFFYKIFTVCFRKLWNLVFKLKTD